MSKLVRFAIAVAMVGVLSGAFAYAKTPAKAASGTKPAISTITGVVKVVELNGRAVEIKLVSGSTTYEVDMDKLGQKLESRNGQTVTLRGFLNGDTFEIRQIERAH